MPTSDKRVWEQLDVKLRDGVKVAKIACYHAVWSHPLNGDGIKDETGIKYDYSLNFEMSNVNARDDVTAKNLFLDKVQQNCNLILSSPGIYLIHMRAQISDDLIVGERLSYTPLYIVQALIEVA